MNKYIKLSDNYCIKIFKDKIQLLTFNKNWIVLSEVTEWRFNIIMNYLDKIKKKSCDDWYTIAKILVLFEAINSALTFKYAIHFLYIVDQMEPGDIFFWASEFLNRKEKAQNAFRILYTNE